MIKLVLDGFTRLVIDFVQRESKAEILEDLMSFLIADAFYLYVLDYAIEDVALFKEGRGNVFINYVFFVTILDWGLHKLYFGRPNLVEQLVKVAIVGGVWEIYISMYPEEARKYDPKCMYERWRLAKEKQNPNCV